ncbi:MAG: DsbA family protein [Gemmatimonadaceae bacterium]
MLTKVRYMSANLQSLILVVCAISVTGMALRNELRNSRGRASGQIFEKRSDWREFAVGENWIGDRKAPVTIVEFADFECPACKTLETRLHEAAQKHPKEFAVLYRHFPLEIHPFSQISAIASECAARQNRFAQMHDSLFSNQTSFGKKPWTEIALTAGVSDTARFALCMTDSKISAKVAEDRAAGGRLGVTGTPSLLINEIRVTGAPSPLILDSLIAKALSEKNGARGQ